MSAAPKDEKKEEPAEAPKPRSGRKMGPMLGAVAVVLVLQAGLAFGVVRFLGISDHGAGKSGQAKSSDDDASAGGDDSKPGSTPKNLQCLEKPLSKTVTIAGTEAKRYLKASLCLEYDADKYKDLPKDIEPQMMRVEATVNRILSSASFQQVSDPKAQDTLATQMGSEINQMLKPDKIQIHAVLVTEWLVQ
jgi:flagellar FliL protein